MLKQEECLVYRDKTESDNKMEPGVDIEPGLDIDLDSKILPESDISKNRARD